MLASAATLSQTTETQQRTETMSIQSQHSDQLPWVEKYRPKKLQDLIAHNDITSTISRFIAADRLPHLLFYGPPGTGKTSTILALAKQMYGKSYKSMILELNASDDRGTCVYLF